MKEIHEQVKIVLAQQCKIVGARYEDIDFNNDLWFFERQWTEEQESEFIEWLTNHLYNNLEARAAIMSLPSKNKSMCKRTAEAFAFNFGWKYKE